jgi:hypothetical protein
MVQTQSFGKGGRLDTSVDQGVCSVALCSYLASAPLGLGPNWVRPEISRRFLQSGRCGQPYAFRILP